MILWLPRAKNRPLSLVQGHPCLSLQQECCACAGVPISNQMRDIQRGADIVVGTPGRIMDLQARGALDLSQVCLLTTYAIPLTYIIRAP